MQIELFTWLSPLPDLLPAAFKVSPNSSQIYVVPYVCVSNYIRPDAVLWFDVSRQVWQEEQTVCFETNAADASISRAKNAPQTYHLSTNVKSCHFRWVLEVT